MKQLKKHAIGYNTVSSKNGVINGRGVKSKPNNMEIYGYTHEIGEGEKSPDNPYILESLDSGAMSVAGIDYQHSIKLNNGDMSIQVPTPVALHSVAGKSNILTKNGSIWGIKVRTSVFNSNDYIDTLKYHGESSTGTYVYRIGDTVSTEQELKGNISVCISNFLRIMPQSIDMENVAKLFHLGDKKWLFIRYQHSLYPQFSSAETLKEFLLENPIEIIFPADAETFIPLSDYAQDLLNSFTLQNTNRISVESYPDLKISGYIQK